ncbi:zinc metallopeptidase [Raineya orbicola]|jgi:Zn-dependent membrane protease YugP|uniref:Putative Zn-dependent protease n=1 Tax=Raineya orbicola TaxID=2016530 RepID=A0A2N3II60_9BACT|nr:zinc metallopeptidase [Raineya orbicola]PKQ69976.1 putative Zn-dependent protease [Raineya orbicola]
MYWIILGVTMLVSWLVSNRLRSKFAHYSQIRLRNGMTGREAAEQMLRDYGIYDVQITCVPGQLTDHYNPMNKTVNLSEEVYYGSSAAAVAVAAHECGHAVQHATAYSMLQFRSAMVPLQNVSATILNFVMIASFIGGYALYRTIPITSILWVIVIAYSVITLFSLVTLPVEFDASKRALVWMTNRGVVSSQEHTMAKDALFWAAMTYVVAAIGSLAMLAYYVLQLVAASSRER